MSLLRVHALSFIFSKSLLFLSPNKPKKDQGGKLPKNIVYPSKAPKAPRIHKSYFINMAKGFFVLIYTPITISAIDCGLHLCS